MPRPDPLTTLATPDHWMVVQFGDSPAYVAEGPEFSPFFRLTDQPPICAAFPTREAAQDAIRTAQSMATIDLSILLARSL